MQNTKLELNDEEWELVNRVLPDYREKSKFSLEEVKTLLSTLRLNLAGHEIRDIVKEPAGGYSLQDVNNILPTAREKAKQRNETQENLLKTALNVNSIEGALQSKHTYSHDEEQGFTNWLNKNLGKDKECLDAGDIPMDYQNHDLFKKLSDGIVLCKVINLAVENTIDVRTINKAGSLNHIIKKHENLTLAINSAAAIGCCVTNIGASEIMEGKQHIILGLIWQLIRKGIVDTVTLSKHAELAALLRPGETLEDLNKLKPEELLMRWVNFQLERAGSDRRMKNFGEDIHDSEIYGTLLNQIAPDHLKSQIVPASTILSKNSLEDRANDVCSNATKMDAGSFLQPDNIYNAKKDPKKYEKLHLGFVATLFNLYPNMDPPKEIGDLDAYKENLEEKTYRNWMNSLGVSPYVNHLYNGTNDGLIFLQLIDHIKEGTVDQSKIVKKYDTRKEIFQKQANCAKVVEYGRSIGLKMVNISGEDIRNSEKKLVLGACFQMMQAYLMKLFRIAVGSDTTLKGDEEVLLFVNEQLKNGGANTITGFRDKSLVTSRAILDVVEQIKPGSVEKSNLGDDNFANAVYALSVARKNGAKVYALPEHIVQLDGKMIMTIFLCLMILYHETKKN